VTTTSDDSQVLAQSLHRAAFPGHFRRVLPRCMRGQGRGSVIAAHTAQRADPGSDARCKSERRR
jgi:hypothetical protein